MLKCWTGLDGTLCKHLFYEHCSAVLIKHISPKDFFYPSDWFTESNNCDIIAYILIYPNSIGVCRLDTCFRASNSVAREGLVDSILVAEETKHLELFFVQTQFIFNLSPVNDLKPLRRRKNGSSRQPYFCSNSPPEQRSSRPQSPRICSCSTAPAPSDKAEVTKGDCKRTFKGKKSFSSNNSL